MSLSYAQLQELDKYQQKFLNGEISAKEYEFVKADVLSWNNEDEQKNTQTQKSKQFLVFIYGWSLFLCIVWILYGIFGDLPLLSILLFITFIFVYSNAHLKDISTQNFVEMFTKVLKPIWKLLAFLHHGVIEFAKKKWLSPLKTNIILVGIVLLVMWAIVWEAQYTQYQQEFLQKQQVEEKLAQEQEVAQKDIATTKDAVQEPVHNNKPWIQISLTGTYLSGGIIRIHVNTELKNTKFAVRMRAKNYTSIYDANGNYINQTTYLASSHKGMYDNAFDHNNNNDTNGLCDITDSPFMMGNMCQKRNIYELITPEQYKTIKTFEKREGIDEASVTVDDTGSGTVEVYPYYPDANAFSCDSDDELRLAQKFQVGAALSQKCYLLSEWVLTVQLVIPLLREYEVNDISIDDAVNGISWTIVPKNIWTKDVQLPEGCSLMDIWYQEDANTLMLCNVDIKIDGADILKMSELATKQRNSDTSFKKKASIYSKEIAKDKQRLTDNAEYQKRAWEIASNREWAKTSYYIIAKACEKRTLELLVSPKTAEFSSPSVDSIHFNDDKIRYNGYVDSQNAYWALLRSNYRCDVEKYTENGEELIRTTVELY